MTYAKSRWVVAAVLATAAAAACTKVNPAATCADGTCIDPSFPFCDVDGSLSGSPGACIAVTCAPGSIGGCEGSAELICDGSGTNYTTMACTNGCSASAGCLECAPNQKVCTTDGNFQVCDAAGSATTTVCANGCDATTGCLACAPSAVTCTADGKLQTCGSDGAVASTEACALGCSDTGGSHCKQIVPSNGLQQYIDMTPNPVDLTLAGGTLDLDTSKFTPTGGSAADAVAVPSFKMAAPTGGSPVVVFVGKKITLGKLLLRANSSAAQQNGGLGPAVAFLATSDLTVGGDVTVASGAIDEVGCTGNFGPTAFVGSTEYDGGGGGGGNATAGADGGRVIGVVGFGARGGMGGNATLVPLRGGCPGGSIDVGPGFGGHGGGAIQLFSRTAISIDSIVDADGLPSDHIETPADEVSIGGGGGGGSVLLESPSVALGISADLLARGGAGASGDFGQVNYVEGGAAIPGAVCTTQNATCSNGGAGASATLDPVAGVTMAMPAAGDTSGRRAGGGGGGLGRIRINTVDSTFTKQPTTVLAGQVTAGIANAQ